MDFIFQGFQSSLPIWVYVLVFVGTALLAWWSYRSIGGIRKSYRYILTGIRAAVFFILLLLLLNPFVKTETAYYQRPEILVMLDNSASTAIQKSDYQGAESYRRVLEQLDFGDSSDVNFTFFEIGNQTSPADPGKLDFKSDQTNLSSALQTLKGKQSEAKAAVLISDGIYTKGENPVFETKDLKLPVFTVGLGDTTYQKDVLVSSVSTNSTGYVNSSQPVTVTIQSSGFKGRSLPVELRKGDRVIARQTVTPQIENGSQEITFELPLETKGLQQFQIRIPKLTDEWTQSNNLQRFSVDVKDARQHILSLAFEVYPDVKMIRSLLLGDKNTELSTRTWLRGNRFVEGDFNFDPDSIDLAIIHGYPRSGLAGPLQQKVKRLAENVPLIVVDTPLFAPQSFERQIASLPVSVVGPWQPVSVSIHPEVKPTEHPIMELPATTYDRLPMVSAPIENLDNAPGATKLFSSSYRGNDTQKPILVTQELGNRRKTLVTGFGWYKFNQDSRESVRNFVQQLWMNIISWTATDPENQLLEVSPTQTSFTGSEPVVVNAYLHNERGQLESDASIDISVSSDSMETRFYTMENKGSGQYQLDLGTMPEGLYSFEASAQKGDRTIDEQTGEFAVARSNAEFLDVNRNEQLLRQVSQRTGGSYVPFDSVDGFWNRLRDRGLLDQQEKVQTSFFYPYRHLAWFVIVLLLLCAEWGLRKYLSLP